MEQRRVGALCQHKHGNVHISNKELNFTDYNNTPIISSQSALRSWWFPYSHHLPTWKCIDFLKKNLDIEHLPPSSFSSRNNSLVYCSVITFSSYIPFTWDINVFKVWHSFSSRLAKDWTSASRTAGSYGTSSCCRSFKTPPSTTHHRKPSDLDRVSASARTASLHCFSLTCSKNCWVVCWSFTRRLETVWSLMSLYAIYSCWKSP